MNDNTHLLEALAAIPVSELDYNGWCEVGMALKQEGFGVEVWDDWSRADSRYHPGECAKKWDSFRGTGTPVTGGTIVQMAKDRGWVPGGRGQEIGWDDLISAEKDDMVIVDHNWLEGKELPPPMGNPVQQITTYLETLFDSSDLVGYVTDTWEKDGKFMPKKGNFDRTAGQLIEELSICDGDIGAVFGDCNPASGAWIRFNPLDGQGVRNENVTAFNYALVESDEMPIEEQYAVIQALELPVACLVHSGGKSLHAIVRVDAPNYSEYQRRVDYLYAVCQKNGLKIDRQNRNPSRLSRMPGVTRNGREQALIAVQIGKNGWDEWKEWVEAVNDDLPDIQNISAVKNNRPPLAPELIQGVLRRGHKMLLSGASKASKSFALIELAIAIAEGKPWLGFQCSRGRVLYVNLELDTNSCWNRILDVYESLHLEISDNLDVWPLRGRACPMDKLTPKLIRRASKQDYAAIIIDPIYKVLTGDENAADQMAIFCNMFDRVAVELGCSVIYCHHHSKGNQGSKRSMDRASGSGVFARDPDALLDMIELELTDDIRKQRKNNAVCSLCGAWLEHCGMSDKVSQDDLCSETQSMDACKRFLPPEAYSALLGDIAAKEKALNTSTALRIEGTLREFPKFPAVNIWFEYPVHRVDTSGVLADIDPDGEVPMWKKGVSARKTPGEKTEEQRKELENAFDTLIGTNGGNTVSVKELMEYLNISSINTLKTRVKKHGGFFADKYSMEGRIGKL